MIKRVIEVASQIAQNAKQNHIETATLESNAAVLARSADYVYNRVFVQAIEVLAGCPEFDPDFREVEGHEPDLSYLSDSGEEPDVRDIQEEIASGFYDDDVLAIPLSKDNYWCSPIDGRPHYVDDDGWIYGRGYQPVVPDAVIIREAVGSDGEPYETRTSAKYFGWANVKRFKIDK